MSEGAGIVKMFIKTCLYTEISYHKHTNMLPIDALPGYLTSHLNITLESSARLGMNIEKIYLHIGVSQHFSAIPGM